MQLILVSVLSRPFIEMLNSVCVSFRSSNLGLSFFPGCFEVPG